MMKLIPIKPISPNIFGGNAASDGMAATTSLDFSSLVKESVKNIADQLKSVEVFSNLSTINQVELHELATKLSETELKLKTLLGIRDSVMSILQELNRMQI